MLPNAFLLFDEPMSRHTTFKIGGKSDALLSAKDSGEVITALRFCQEQGLPCFVMGNGSNLLVRDGGIRGVVVKIHEHMQAYSLSGDTATAQAGCKLALLVRETVEKNLAGLEFAGGIPGTVGGAVLMNAGAYGGCMADCLRQVTYIDERFELCQITPGEKDMGYRDTVFSRNGYIVVRAEFSFSRCTDGSVRERYEACNTARRSKQPLSLPSAGSAFKRPEGHFAGQLIQNAGLKGESVGAAQVSPLHAGFIVNNGGARACDVLALMALVQRRVFDDSGVRLEPEIKIVGEDA